VIESEVLAIITDIFWVLGVILVYQFCIRLLANTQLSRPNPHLSALRIEWLSVLYFGAISVYLELMSQQGGNIMMFTNFRLIFLLFTTVFFSTGSALTLLAICTITRVAIFGLTAGNLWINAILGLMVVAILLSKRTRWMTTGRFFAIALVLCNLCWVAVYFWGPRAGVQLSRSNLWLSMIELTVLFVGVYYALTVLTQTNEFMREMTRLATTDSLTRLRNFNDFSQVYPRVVKREQNKKGKLALIALDIDHFKSINDEYGHTAGNAALRYLGAELTNIAGSDVVPFRIGGEEFEILISGRSRASVTAIANAIHQLVQANPIDHEGQRIQLTISAGVAWATPDDCNADALFERADQMLYQAKRDGRNRIQFDHHFEDVGRAQ